MNHEQDRIVGVAALNDHALSGSVDLDEDRLREASFDDVAVGVADRSGAGGPGDGAGEHPEGDGRGGPDETPRPQVHPRT
jgi:hypothetical protein